LGGDTLGLHLDVSDHAGFSTLLDDVEHELGPIDAVINNAGIMSLALLDEESEQTIARHVAVNLTAVIHGTREAIVRMKSRRTHWPHSQRRVGRGQDRRGRGS
jgi:NAD(P)-dependent dehydrogenase (short-subunit alcohol dehydrogenase family)